jgi:hypothetical protein
MKYLKNYDELILEKQKIASKLKNPNYVMTKREFIQTATAQMPDELLEMIYNWDFLKKSPCGHSYYNAKKDWESFVDDAIRVSDHWNFTTGRDFRVHCQTVQKNIENNKYWYVGVYNELTDKYNIIKKYPILDRKNSESEFLKEKFKETSRKPSEDIMELGKTFKERLKKGKVKARLSNGEIVTVVWRGSRSWKSFAHDNKRNEDDRRCIKYEKDGELIETRDYELVNEYTIK